jgi:hypothetical protein
MAATSRTLLLASLLVASSAALGADRAEVSFRDPVNFADAGFGTVERERNLGLLAAHLHHLAERLPAGQSLHVEMLDVDLAGEIQLIRTHPIRVVGNTADAPQIVLRFELRDGAKVVRSGEERLIDVGYQWSLPDRFDDAPLRFERRMLDNWFEQRFDARIAALR